ncbi:unnamed protein product [Anisakis simplex]|uniref:Mextli (inferred by orthology to a D. melanogaster protein) n=1 Tax=Anisakis simplex TaxID=6269 RepID=A0A0M3JRG6_ANISI|nr:unnamed protein product [Anisakis simplex]
MNARRICMIETRLYKLNNATDELNRVFVSLRQACCRDNGQLGTPCRLKMMELVELRAMGWRPSLAHTQYYLNRPEQPPQIEPGPVSAPPFGAIPVNPFGNYAPPPPPLYVGSDMGTTQVIAPQPTQASFYLIPAAGGWARPMIAPGVVPPTNILPQVSPIDMEAWAKANKTQSSKLKLKTPQNRTPQLRDEMLIRNSDSGKIMGVKGRRVAVVEELSKTVISFQKVDPKSKDRTLTITGSTQESIDYAKRLIEQTIRRNVSPNRSDNGGPEVDDNEEEDVGISIETTQDGTLKLSCADPQVLQAAQAALSEYLTRAGRSHSKLSAEERELRKERRKSMPLSSSSSNRANVTKFMTNAINWQRLIQLHINSSEWRSTGKTGSTPNLARLVSSDVARYSRSQMLELRFVPGRLDTKTTKTVNELEIMRP